MKRISAIAMALMLMIGLTVEAQAVTSGVLKCYILDGPVSPGGAILPVIVIYNPNPSGTQKLTRLRLFDTVGTALADFPLDPNDPANQIPARGSFVFAVGTSPSVEGFQVLLNWQQGADTVGPITRLNLLMDNGVDFTSVSQSNCP